MDDKSDRPEVVEDGHVGEHVVDVVGVGRILVVRPLVGRRHVAVEQRVLRLRLVVHAVQPDHVAQEAVQVRVTLRILYLWKIFAESLHPFKT